MPDDSALEKTPISAKDALAQQSASIPPEKRNFSPAMERKIKDLLTSQTPSNETVTAPTSFSEKKFANFSTEDWKKYIKEKDLKTITVGKGTIVFPSPDSEGNYIAITEMGIIRFKDEINGSLGRAIESRLKEIGTDDRLNTLRRSREKIEEVNGQLRITILAGNKDFPIELKNPAALEPNNETVSRILEKNENKSQRSLATAAR